MKKFKSILALTASVLALSAFAAPVSAFAEGFANNDSSTDVKDTVVAGYMVTIPADVTFNNNTGSGTLIAEGATTGSSIVLNAGKALKVSVESQNGLKLRQTGVATELATYSVTAEATANTTTVSSSLSGMSTAETPVLLATFANNTTDTVTLTFTEGDKNTVPAGEYKDTLTFTIEVADATP